jgi:hypothetical protein
MGPPERPGGAVEGAPRSCDRWAALCPNFVSQLRDSG